MGTTPNRAYRYPASTDAPRVWEDMQELATDIDTDMAAQLSAWTSYTPVLTAASVNPVLGSGSVQHGRYKQIGKTVHCEGYILFGSSGASFGTGTWSVSLPVASANQTNASWIGTTYLRDTSGGSNGHYMGNGIIAANSSVMALGSNGSALVASIIPFTWAVTDYIRWSATYESA